MKWLASSAIVAIIALAWWLEPGSATTRPGTAGAVGTMGVHPGAAEAMAGAVVTEIETITGAVNGMALVGRRVDLHVDVIDRAGRRAFWIGSPDNRVLVVMGRPTGHDIVPVRGGQRAAVSGVIRPAPGADAREAWQISEEDAAEVLDRRIYIRGETVASEGHGHR